jgi:hypothetical protein
VNNPWPALAVAVALVGIGVSLMTSHVRSWRRQRTDPTLDEQDRVYYHRRYRRRMQISAMLAILGVLIGMGDAMLPFQGKHPIPTTLYWIGVLLMTGWVMLLGFGDLLSTAAYGRAELARVRQKQRELERQVVEFKHRNLDGRGSEDAAR